MNHGVRLAVVAVILALGMILSVFVVSKLFVRVRHEQAITVKGYAEKDVVSDKARNPSFLWEARYARRRIGPAGRSVYHALRVAPPTSIRHVFLFVIAVSDG